MTQETFFRDRAVDARRDAEATALPNVRERCLRSAATWETMADREQKMATARAQREADKAGAIEAAGANLTPEAG